MRKGEATKARIVEAASRQAAVKGLAGVSLNDVAQAVGLSKSGLFKHFDSKEAMQQDVVQGMLDRFVALVWTPVADMPPGRERLEAIFERWLGWCDEANDESGCPIHALAIELDDQAGPLRDMLHQGLQRWYRTLARDFAALRDPPLGVEEAQLAVFQAKSFIFGYGEETRLMGNANARKMTRAAFDALMERTASPR